MNSQQQCRNILETYGGKTADKAVKMLLEDPALKEMQPILKFVSQSWRDPLTPAMINLSCQAVGGKTKETQEIAIALSLMNLSFRVWDDIIDKTFVRQFKPTLVGKFDNSAALIFGGVVSAKAFTIVNQSGIDPQKRQIISSLLWNYWAKMAETEAVCLHLKSGKYSSRDKLSKIENEATNLETCLKIGAIIGNGPLEDVKELGIYGQCIGVIIELLKDLQASFNLTFELEEKIKHNSLPYTLLKAKEESNELQEKLDLISNKTVIEPYVIGDIADLILQTGALKHVEKLVAEKTKKAKVALNKIKGNSATEALRDFIIFQTQIIKETANVSVIKGIID